MKKFSLLAVCLTLFCTSAFAFDPAATPNYEKSFGIIAFNTPMQFGKMDLMAGDFYHKYTFTLPDSMFNISAITLQFPGVSSIENFTAYLYKKDSLEKIFEVTGASLTKNANLLAGDYFLALTGRTSGIGGYTGILAGAKPVPLPGAALFLGAGFLGLVGLRRRNLNV